MSLDSRSRNKIPTYVYPKNQSFDLFFNLLTIPNTKISKIFVKQSIKYLPNISSQFFTLSYFTITLLRKSEVKRLHKLENVPNWRLRMLLLDREKKKFSIRAIICVEMTGSNWSWSPWQGLETRARPYLLFAKISEHSGTWQLSEDREAWHASDVQLALAWYEHGEHTTVIKR